MGEVPPDKIARLARRGKPAAVADKAKKAIDRATIEVHNWCVVQGYSGDTLLFTFTAPSGVAAKACAKALRDLQARRGSVF